MLWGEIVGYWRGLFQASSFGGNCNKVDQDISIWASVESCPSQGQMGEAQEKIYCKKKKWESSEVHLQNGVGLIA